MSFFDKNYEEERALVVAGVGFLGVLGWAAWRATNAQRNFRLPEDADWYVRDGKTFSRAANDPYSRVDARDYLRRRGRLA